jgi:hypothetical protein
MRRVATGSVFYKAISEFLRERWAHGGGYEHYGEHYERPQCDHTAHLVCPAVSVALEISFSAIHAEQQDCIKDAVIWHDWQRRF